MSLKLYFDSEGTEPIQSPLDSNAYPDTIREAVESGETVTDVTTIYLMSSNTDLTYENITLTSYETETNGVTVEYRLEGDTTWQASLTITDGNYTTSQEIERRVQAENVQEAFFRDDIKHRLSFDEYIA